MYAHLDYQQLTCHYQDYSETTKADGSNFQPLEVVSRYRDPQLKVAENWANKCVS